MNEKKENHNWRMFIAGILAGALVMSFVMLIVILTITRKASRTYSAEAYVSADGGIMDSETISKIEQINKLFVDNSIYNLDKDELRRGAIEGYLTGTGDAYTTYYSADEIEMEMTNYSGKFYGIGVVISQSRDTKEAEVQQVYSDSPASRAGFRTGDIIKGVDGKDVSEMSLDDIVKLIRGPKGTKVSVEVYRSSENGKVTLVPVRDEIVQIIEEHRMIGDGIGYIHIEEWFDTTAEQFKAAKEELESQGMNKALIIDLRSNTGGLLSAAVDTLDVCLPAEPVLHVEDNQGNRKTYSTYDSYEINLPIVILTDGYTASASEIFTGAMKDYDRAVSIGTKTYGKGVVQGFYYLDDGSAIKLTIEEYFTPNGVSLDGNGIDPNVEIEFDSEAYYDTDEQVDNQLQEAVEYIKENY